MRVLIPMGLALAAACPVTALASTAGVFQFVAGDVRLMPLEGSERTPRKGTPLSVGDTVATGGGAIAQIKMGDGAIIVVQPESRLTVAVFNYAGEEDGSEKVVYRLEHGGFRSVTGAIGRKNKSNYLIETPIAQMGVRGTDHESYYFPATGAGNAAGPRPGAYNKVNVGQTFLRTRSGEVVISPNQVGYVASAQNTPGLLPAVPEFFNRAVAPRSARIGNGAFPIAAMVPSAPQVEQSVSIITGGVNGAGFINLSTLPPTGVPGTTVPGSGSVAAFVEPVGLSTLARSAANPAITPLLAVLAHAGGDTAWGVNWGSWQGGVATVNGSPTVGSAHFAQTSNLTSATQLAALGPGLVSATYNYLGGPGPTSQGQLGAPGTISSLSVGVNFATQTITSYSLAATVDTKVWTASGSGTIAQLGSGPGIALSGSCSTCGLPVVPGSVLGGPATASGTAHGAFVGGAAERMITAFGLNAGTHAIAGVGYLGR